MDKDKERNSILQAVKERVKQSEEHQLTQVIADAIGERRYRDLKDLISRNIKTYEARQILQEVFQFSVSELEQ